MNIWEILDIQPTEDIRIVKRAYAKQCKIYHPETHPQEFQLLHNAYKTVLAIIESGKREVEEDVAIDIRQDMSMISIPLNFPIQADDENTKQEEEQKKENAKYLENLEALAKEQKKWSVPKDICKYFAWMLYNEFDRKPWKKYVLSKEFLEKQYEPEFVARISDILGEKLLKIREEKKGAIPLATVVYFIISYGCVYTKIGDIDINERLYNRQVIMPLINALKLSTSVLMAYEFLENNEALVGERYAFYVYRNILEIMDQDVPDKERMKYWLEEGFKPYDKEHILEILHINRPNGYKLASNVYRLHNIIYRSPVIYELVAYLLESKRKNVDVLKEAFREVCEVIEIDEEMEILLLMLE